MVIDEPEGFAYLRQLEEEHEFPDRLRPDAQADPQKPLGLRSNLCLCIPVRATNDAAMTSRGPRPVVALRIWMSSLPACVSLLPGY